MIEPRAIPKEGVYIEGVEGGNALLSRVGSNGAIIELYDEDHETHLGTLPADTPAHVINAVLKLIDRAEKRGIEYGKRSKQYEVLAVLGIEKPFDLMKRADD
jgi:hypothetical protein